MGKEGRNREGENRTETRCHDPFLSHQVAGVDEGRLTVILKRPVVLKHVISAIHSHSR